MGIEFELKYQATPAILQQLQQDVEGKTCVFHMQTAYYDTPGEQLSRRHWTLRRRMENDTSVCTLKTPADGLGRREWEVVCDRIEDGIDALCKLGAPKELKEIAGEGLVNICGARFTRTAKTLEMGDCALELALDKGILTGGGKELSLCEVEVELKSGSQATCLHFARQLAARYGLVPEPKSKFRRALALYRGE